MIESRCFMVLTQEHANPPRPHKQHALFCSAGGPELEVDKPCIKLIWQHPPPVQLLEVWALVVLLVIFLKLLEELGSYHLAQDVPLALLLQLHGCEREGRVVVWLDNALPCSLVNRLPRATINQQNSCTKQQQAQPLLQPTYPEGILGALEEGGCIKIGLQLLAEKASHQKILRKVDKEGSSEQSVALIHAS